MTVPGPSMGMSQAPRVTVGRANSSSLLRLGPCARRDLGVLGVRPGLAWWGDAGRMGWGVPRGEFIPTLAADDLVDRFHRVFLSPSRGLSQKSGGLLGTQISPLAGGCVGNPESFSTSPNALSTPRGSRKPCGTVSTRPPPVLFSSPSAHTLILGTGAQG